MQWRVSDVMNTDVAIAYEDTPVTKIIEILAGRDVCGVLILDQRDRVVGIVSPDDLLPTIAAVHGNARAPHRHTPVKAAATQAWQLLKSPVPTVRAVAPLAVAAEQMRATRASQLVATGEFGEPLGVVTSRDVDRIRGRREDFDDQAAVGGGAGRVAGTAMAGARSAD
ncbi:CBS domain-containing protein [Catellatospora sp. NPDC049609]|uniref:CBS domain-containing protein n=1 Tax=Catellatospora sp. NPDC049609 TaxID=3155505 RepID=UPI00343832BA